jgi:type II secretion system protein C
MFKVSIEREIMQSVMSGVADQLKRKFDLNQIKKICKKRYGIETIKGIKQKDANIVIIENQVACKLDFEIRFPISVLIATKEDINSTLTEKNDIRAEIDAIPEDGLYEMPEGLQEMLADELDDISAELESLMEEEIDDIPEPVEDIPVKSGLPPLRKSRRAFYLLYLLLFIVPGYLGFQGIQTMKNTGRETDVVAAPDVTGVRVATQQKASIRPLSDYQVIRQRNQFSDPVAKDTNKENEISMEKIAPAKKDLGLELVGTFVTDDSKLSFAIINNYKIGKQKSLLEGDIFGKVKIKKIMRDNVIITTDAGDALLTIANKNSEKGSAPSESTSSTRTGTIEQLQRHEFKASLQLEEVQTSFSDFEALKEEVRLSPYIKGNQISGFEINNIPADSVLLKMGLRNRDVIVGVDDEEITSADQIQDFFQKVAAGGEVTFRSKRGQRTRHIRLSIY